MNKFVVILVFPLFLTLQPAESTPAPRIVCFDLPPFVIDQKGIPTGPAVDLAKQILAKAGLPTDINLVPLPRGLAYLDEGNTIFILLTRTPAREPKYTWVTEIYQDALSFATLAPASPINSYREAGVAGRILCQHGGAPEAMLKVNNLSNFDDTATSDPSNYDKLKAGRGVAWFCSTAEQKLVNSQAGKPVLTIGKPVEQAPMWMLASKDIDLEMVKKLQTAAEDLRNQGAFGKAFALLD